MRFLPFALVCVLSTIPSFIEASVLIKFWNQGTTYDGNSSVILAIYDPDSDDNFNMTVSSTGGNLNSNNDQFGIGDDFIDPGEILSISFDTDVLLTEFDFAAVGSNVDDGVQAIMEGTTYTLHTGATDYNGTTKEWTPLGGILLQANNEILLSTSHSNGDENFHFESINLVVVPSAPEPRAIILLAIGALGLLTRRQRNQAA